MSVLSLSPRAAALDALASLLDYPTDGFAGRAAAALEDVEAASPEAAKSLEPFVAHVASMETFALEEAFTRTFDWSATCSLEVGWHLYGEQYDRGQFMVAMRERLRAVGVAEGDNLPDHLGSCLRWLSRATGEEAAPFAAASLLPALEKILSGLREGSDPYAAVADAVATLVRETAGAPQPAPAAEEGTR